MRRGSRPENEMSDEPLTHRTLLAPGMLPHAEEENEATSEEGASAKPGVEPEPPGGPLAELLVEGLKRRGWSVEYRWTTYDGHAFDAKRKDIRYDVEVRCLDERLPAAVVKAAEVLGATEEVAGEGLWLVSAKRRTGFFKHLFQGRSDPAEHSLLRLHIDECLAGDPRTVGEMRNWQTEAEATGARG